eukprot:94126_1
MSNGLLSWHRNFFLFLSLLKERNVKRIVILAQKFLFISICCTHTNKNTTIIRPKIQNTKTQKHPTQTISTSKIHILSPTISPIQPSRSPTTTISPSYINPTSSSPSKYPTTTPTKTLSINPTETLYINPTIYPSIHTSQPTNIPFISPFIYPTIAP